MKTLAILILTLIPFSDMTVTRVIDGDTVVVTAPFMPPPFKKTLNLRINGVDTAERGWRAKCAKERLAAEKAKRFVKDLINNAKEPPVVYIKGWGKVGGRVIGDIKIDGEFLSKKLVDTGHGVVYHGKGKKHDWCV